MGNAAVSAAPAAAPAAAPTQDYSAQWAAYYRSIGKIGEAEAIEAQARLKQVRKSCTFSLYLFPTIHCTNLVFTSDYHKMIMQSSKFLCFEWEILSCHWYAVLFD